MRSMALALLLIAAAVPVRAEDIRKTLDSANEKFMAAVNKGDAAAVAQFYTPNATILPAGAPMGKGREAAQRIWQGAIDSGLKFVSLQTVSADRHGGYVREIGQFTVQAPNAQKQITAIDGKYVAIWKHEKSGWKLDTDIWNMNQ